MVIVERILCPVDSSPFSERALRYSAALASWYGAELVALSVRPSLLPSALPLALPVSVALKAADTAAIEEEALQAFVVEAVGTVAARVVVTDGPVVSEIVRVGGELPADLIVMGTHGLSGFEHLLLGSVTEKVLRKAPCPVLTVPRLATEPAQAVTFKTIVCAVDFSPASLRAFDYALSLAQEAGGRLVLVHALELFAEEQPRLTEHFNVPEFRQTLEREARQQLESLVSRDARTWCDPEVIVGHGKAYQEVLRLATERAAELIVLGVQGRSAIDRALFGSTTQHVVRQARCPVLTVGPISRAAAAAA